MFVYKGVILMYYISKISYNNLTYSIDMIRLKTYIDYDVYSNFDFYLNTYHKNFVEKFWISDRKMMFKYNYQIEVGEGVSFYLGFHHNNEKDVEPGLHNLTIEFNPNKLKDNALIKHILNLSGDWFIRSYDLAVDLKCNILDLIFDKVLKRHVHTFSNGGDDITFNVGKGDLRLKIYNKKRESKLNIIGDLTRVEISREVDDFPVRDVKMLNWGIDNFPDIYLNNYVYSFSDYKDKTMLPIIYAVQNGFPISDLSRRYKEKIKKMFEGGQKIRFTDKDATEVLRKTIFTYFMQNKKVRWR